MECFLSASQTAIAKLKVCDEANVLLFVWCSIRRLIAEVIAVFLIFSKFRILFYTSSYVHLKKHLESVNEA